MVCFGDDESCSIIRRRLRSDARRCGSTRALWVYVERSARILGTIDCAGKNLDRASTTAAADLRRGKGYAQRDIACRDDRCGEKRVRRVTLRHPRQFNPGSCRGWRRER